MISATKIIMATTDPVTHVIFDVDGLILDTETLYTSMMHKLCRPHGKEFTFQLKMKLMGKKQKEAGQVLIDELDLPITVEEYCRSVDELILQTFPDATLLPGADKLIRHLHKHGVPIAIATGSHSEEMDIKTMNHKQLFALFDHAVYSSSDPDVKNGKPAPDCFLVAANRFINKPASNKQCLVLEDAPNGVEGALAAGMQVVWVPAHFMDKAQLSDKATLTMDSLEEFKPEMFGLPPYDE